MNSYLFNYSLVHHKKYTMAKCNGIMYLFMCLLTYGVLFILFYFILCFVVLIGVLLLLCGILGPS